jgi:hypothetical protein
MEYRQLQPGLFELGTPVGPMPVTATEAQLRAAGHMPSRPGLTAPGSRAIAQMDPRQMAALNAQHAGATNETASDAMSMGQLEAERIAEADDARRFGGGGPTGYVGPRGEGRPVDRRVTHIIEESEDQRPQESGFSRLVNRAKRRDDESSSGATRGLERFGAKLEDDGLGELRAGLAPAERRERPTFARVPERDQLAGYTVERKNVNRDTMRDLDKAEERAGESGKVAALGQASGEVRQNADAAYRLGERLIDEEEAIREQERRNNAWRTELAARQRGIDDERRAVDSLEIKPDQMFEGHEWARGIAAIAIIAGGGLQGMKGLSSNPALDAINQAMDRSVALQKDKRDNRRQGVRDKETELERLTKIYGSPDMAEAELRDRQMQLLRGYGVKAALDAGNHQAAANVEAAFAEADAARAASRLEREAALADVVRASHVITPEHSVQTGGPRPRKPQEIERQISRNGQPIGFVVAPNAREKVQEAVTTWGLSADGARRMREIAALATAGNLDAQREYNSIRSAVLARINVARGQGAMSEGDQANAEQGFPDISKLTVTRAEAETRLRAQESLAREQMNAVLRDNVYVDLDATTPVLPPRQQRKYEQ